jgi:hypothetical protein
VAADEVPIPEIVAKFQRRRGQQIGLYGVVAFNLVLISAVAIAVPEVLVSALGIVIWLSFVVFLIMAIRAAWNFRCPACNERLGLTFNPVSCRNCGALLRKQ